MLGLEVDRREDAFGHHSADKVDPGHPGPGPDLDDRSGADRRGEKPQYGAAAGLDRNRAELGPAPPGSEQRLVLDEPRFGELPTAARLDGVVVVPDDFLLSRPPSLVTGHNGGMDDGRGSPGWAVLAITTGLAAVAGGAISG